MIYIKWQPNDWQWVESNKLYRKQRQIIEEECLNISLAEARGKIGNNQRFCSVWSRSIKDDLKDRKSHNAFTQVCDQFNLRCAYCETQLEKKEDAWLTGYRPSGDFGDYFWLKWEWRNFLILCFTCYNNKRKLNSFELEHENNRVIEVTYDWDLLRNENPLLIHPCVDNPNHHLQFLEDGTVQAKNESEKGAFTIEKLNLNRDDLCQARKEVIESLRNEFSLAIRAITYGNKDDLDVNKLLDRLESSCDPQSESPNPFVGVKIQLVLFWLKQIEEYLKQSITHDSITNDYTRQLYLFIRLQFDFSPTSRLSIFRQKLQKYYTNTQVLLETPQWLIDVIAPTIEVIREEVVSVEVNHNPPTQEEAKTIKKAKTIIDEILKIINEPDSLNRKAALLASRDAIDEIFVSSMSQIPYVAIPLQALRVFLNKYTEVIQDNNDS